MKNQTEHQNIEDAVIKICERAKIASQELANISTEKKNAALSHQYIVRLSASRQPLHVPYME